MAYLKHPELGNKHAPDSELEKLTAEGWVKWPRTKEQKAWKPDGTEEAVASVAAEPEVRTKRKYTRKA